MSKEMLTENFSRAEMQCSHCGECEVTDDLMQTLERMRFYNHQQPLYISSGYRCPDHTIEAAKERPGEHARGMAADILVYGEEALDLLEIALLFCNIKRLGIHQKGDYNSRYIHIGLGNKTNDFPEAIWTY